MSWLTRLGFSRDQSEPVTLPLSYKGMTTQSAVPEVTTDEYPHLPPETNQLLVSSAPTISALERFSPSLATKAPIKNIASNSESESCALATQATASCNVPKQRQQPQENRCFDTRNLGNKKNEVAVLSPVACEGQTEQNGLGPQQCNNDFAPFAGQRIHDANQASQSKTTLGTEDESKTSLAWKKTDKRQPRIPQNSPTLITNRHKRKARPDNSCSSPLPKDDTVGVAGANVKEEGPRIESTDGDEPLDKRRSSRRRFPGNAEDHVRPSRKRQRSPSIPLGTKEAEQKEQESAPVKRDRKILSKRESLRRKDLERETQTNSCAGTNEQLFLDVLDSEDRQQVKRAVKRVRVPCPGSSGSKVYRVYDALRRPSLLARKELDCPLPNTPTLFSSAADMNLRVLYHVTRAHLVNGEVLAAIGLAHDILRSSYAQAEKLLPKILRTRPLPNSGDKAAMMLLREKIAGTWCLYAHLFLQIPDTDPFLGTLPHKGKFITSLTRKEVFQNGMEDHLWNYAITLLSSCASCPLVGNHAAITLSLARIRARQRERSRLRNFTTDERMRGTRAYFAKLVGSAAHWRNNLRLAMQVCKSGLQRCLLSPAGAATRVTREGLYDGFDEVVDLNTTTDGVFMIVSCVQNRSSKCTKTCNPLQNDNTATTVTPEFFTDILNLLQRLRDALMNNPPPGAKEMRESQSVPYLFTDRNGARLICMETNCLSRLEESVNEFETSTEVQLVCEPKQPEYFGRDASCVDGVAWDDCLFFQSMNIVLVKKTDVERYKFVQKVPCCVADFFGPSGSSLAWRKPFEVDGYAKYSSAPVYSDVAHVCSSCDAHFPTHLEKTEHSVMCTGDGNHYGGHKLHMSWETLPVASERSNPGNIAATTGPSTGKVLDIDCSCRTCCPHETFEVIDNWKCHSKKEEAPTCSFGDADNGQPSEGSGDRKDNERCDHEAPTSPNGTASNERHGALNGLKPSAGALIMNCGGDDRYGTVTVTGRRKGKRSQEVSKPASKTKSHGNPVVVDLRDGRPLRSRA
jgi:hypothetical protein